MKNEDIGIPDKEKEKSWEVGRLGGWQGILEKGVVSQPSQKKNHSRNFKCHSER